MNIRTNYRADAIGVLLVLSFALSIAITPRSLIVNVNEIPQFESVIPSAFDGWSMVSYPSIGQISLYENRGADVAALIYDQIIMRTYKNIKGESVMLAVAYGSQQTHELKVHRPETCYVAQGFSVSQLGAHLFKYKGKDIKLVRMIANNGTRRELVSYFIRIGSKYATSGAELKYAMMQYGMSQLIPDGMLFRISSMYKGNSLDDEIRLHDVFLTQFLTSVEDQSVWFLGKDNFAAQ